MKAYIALAPAYGGVIKYTAMSASGDPIEGLHELFPGFDLEPWFYEAMKGLPSPVMFLPYGYAYGDKWVSVRACRNIVSYNHVVALVRCYIVVLGHYVRDSDCV